MKINSKSEKDTIKIAKQFIARLRGGEVILLSGDLGAGKTVFVKGMAEALGIKDVVKSPTFNLMKCYKIKKAPHLTSPRLRREENIVLCHIDAYRLKNLDDLLDIGAEEYLGKPDAITAMEWPERAKGIDSLPGKIIKIKISHGKKENERMIEIK